MAGTIVLADGRRRVDAIREDYAAGMKRSDIARKYECQFQVVYAATRDMGNSDRASAPSSSGGVFPQPTVHVNSGRSKRMPVPPVMQLTSQGTFHEPEYVEEVLPIAEHLFPPS